MVPRLHFKFDPNQDYQQAAIQSVVDLFDDLPRYLAEFSLGGDVKPNLPPDLSLSESLLFDNLIKVQSRNNLPLNTTLDLDDDLVLEGAGNESWRHPSFTVEMETGTGKTYVYLRTIHELRKKYGFHKFIIVVPSIAIYEGVMKNFEVTQSHFRSLYGNEVVNAQRYDGSRLSGLRGFASSPFVEVLVMTLQSFNTATGKNRNTIYRASEQLPGERLPYQWLQETRPILILDEPQNMGSELSKAALRTLHPLFSLRYSATHKENPNLLYRLTPFEAFQRSLVKHIQVDAVYKERGLKPGMVVLQEVKKAPLRAVVRTLVSRQGRSTEEDVELRDGQDLYAKTKRDEHKSGFVVSEINAKDGFVDFEGQERISLDDIFGSSKEDIFRVQIERTVKRHLDIQERLAERGIKVLSLFFIDRVANYVDDKGIIKVIFDEVFERLKKDYPLFKDRSAADVREAYFAKRKKSGTGGEEAFDTDGRNAKEKEAEKAAFALIMQKKDELLLFDEPVAFIFAHSALKEGWDSPNVFQICTLNQTNSAMKKRQEIGRGLRLPVNQDGDRIQDDRVNVLTVIANESYERYAETLQGEYVDDGLAAPPPPTQVGKATVRRNDKIFEHGEFREFWRLLNTPTDYRINVNTDDLVEACIFRLDTLPDHDLSSRVIVERGRFIVQRFTLTVEEITDGEAQIRLEKETTEGRLSRESTLRTYKQGDDLARRNQEPRLRGYEIAELTNQHVKFVNGVELLVGEKTSFESQMGQQVQEASVEVQETETPPVFNLIDRAARETLLTRSTINRIFKGLGQYKKELFLKNPEGFANIFIFHIKETLAAHVVEHLEFKMQLDKQGMYELEDLFPIEREFAQRELVPAGDAGLYDRVQVDSDVERNFVANHLAEGEKRVIGYFKFPPSYKVEFPKLIGNYNPDWGILFREADGLVTLKLVRETKGTEDVGRMQFSNEGRKVKAAEKHFAEKNMNYRVITDSTPNWWEVKS